MVKRVIHCFSAVMAFHRRTILVLLFHVLTTQVNSEAGRDNIQKPCIKQYYGTSSFVCVCNSTYCDTVESESKLPPGEFVLYSTTRDRFRFRKSTHAFKLLTSRIKDVEHIRVDLNISRTRQTIIGFGGTFTDAAGLNIASLSSDAQKLLIDSYFSPSGIEYTLGRVPIASNDMSRDVYSFDFTNGDTGLSKFTISEIDRLYKIPYIDQAVIVSRRNISLYGSPWSSPGWMKTNGDMVGYGMIAGNMSKVYANYLARFMSEYEGFMLHGRMWGLTTQSGPARSCNPESQPQYQSMCWRTNQTRDWVVRDLKQSLVDNGYGHIKVMVMDDNRGQLQQWRQSFDDDAARDAIDGFAIQWYRDTTVSPYELTTTRDQFKDKFLMASEACIRENKSVLLGSWERAEEIGRSIFQDMRHYVSGFTDYNLALNLSGGPSWINNNADSPIIVDRSKDEFYKQPMFYMIGHFSKFVPQGSKAIEVDMRNDTEIEAAGFIRPDNSVVVVLANMGDHDTIVQISDGYHVTDVNLTQHSINTIIWWN